MITQTFVDYILSIPKSLIFNFKYLPFKYAIRLPIIVSHRVWLKKISGKITLSNHKTGSVLIGFGDIGIFDQKKSRTIWEVSGHVIFNGKANIGHGSKISVSGNLSIGKDFRISAESAIIASKSIYIGNNVLISWDSLIMDTDFHKIYDSNGKQTNPSLPIYIGNNVWIGCRTFIPKGIKISEGTIISATSTVTKSLNTKNSIIGGNPTQILKSDVTWES